MTQVRRLLAVFLVLALGAGVVACGSDSDSGGDSGGSQSADASQIEGQTWKLMNIATQGAATSLPNTVKAPTVEFEDGRVSVFAGCNSGSGTAEIGDKTITFGSIALTKKSCGDIANQVETYAMMALKGEVGYELSQGNLTLEGKQVSLIFTKG
jgi:heat shock protein HslJ